MLINPAFEVLSPVGARVFGAVFAADDCWLDGEAAGVEGVEDEVAGVAAGVDGAAATGLIENAICEAGLALPAGSLAVTLAVWSPLGIACSGVTLQLPFSSAVALRVIESGPIAIVILLPGSLVPLNLG